MITSKELENVMSNYYGTENYYRHPLIGITYTDGVQAFAENAGAYWFITDLGLFVREAIKKDPKEDMFSVHLIVKDGKADMVFRNCDNKEVYKKHYDFTDCPDGDWIFYYYVEDRILIWHGEY